MDAEKKLKAIRIYCEGVREDFPETAIWIENILAIVEAERSDARRNRFMVLYPNH
jgi:hypothetical protein